MTGLSAVLARGAPVARAAPHGRVLLDATGWTALADALAAEDSTELLALWPGQRSVHAALLEPGGRLLVASGPAAPGYAALSPARPGAALFERAARDLGGIEAIGAADDRPWLDHAEETAWRPAGGKGLHRMLLGPVHGTVAEAGQFRVTLRGETVVRLEMRLGFTHKGTLSLMRGKPPWAAARFAARLSGDTTVAHSLAFALAAEAAAGIPAPPRAEALRAVMLEWERAASHLRGWGEIAEAAGLPAIAAETGRLREALLRAAEAAFGHRLMMDRAVPGGIAADPTPDGLAALRSTALAVQRAMQPLRRETGRHRGLGARLAGTGRIPEALARRFAAGGVVGRASGRGFDARQLASPLPYAALAPRLVTEQAGDAAARLRLRIAEAEESLRLVHALLDTLPDGPTDAALPARAGEGSALVEGARGDCFAWVSLDDGGAIREAMLRDPSWLHWPLLEAAAEGGSVADLPLIAASVNASCSGCDL